LPVKKKREWGEDECCDPSASKGGKNSAIRSLSHLQGKKGKEKERGIHGAGGCYHYLLKVRGGKGREKNIVSDCMREPSEKEEKKKSVRDVERR